MWCRDVLDVDSFVSMLIKRGCHNVRISFSPKRDLTMAWLVTWLEPHQPNLTGAGIKISELDSVRVMEEARAIGVLNDRMGVI